MGEGRRTPPRAPRRLLERIVPPGHARDGLIGDLHEIHERRIREDGRLAADLWYWREACSAALRYVLARDVGGLAAAGGPRRLDGGGGGMSHVAMRIGSELRQSARRLRRSPGFTAAATLPLAIGIGAATAIFALVNRVVLAPLPYAEADRLVVIRSTLPGYEIDGRLPEIGVFMGQYLHYRERTRLLDELGGYWTFDGTLEGEQGAEYLHLGGATPGLWRALGVRPAAGRLVADDDPWPQGDGRGTTILDHGFWTERWGDPSIVGSAMRQQGMTYEVVGVLPAPLPIAPTRSAMWNSIPDGMARDNPTWTMPALVGRLAPGATPEALERELAGLIAELPERYADVPTIRNSVAAGRMSPRVVSMKDWVLGGVDRTLWALFGSVLLLLVVAVANVTGLSLVRADDARRELAVRLALGSGKRGIALRILAEDLLLVGAAASLGAALAWAVVGAIGRVVPVAVPRMDSAAVGAAEIAFVLVLGLLSLAILATAQLVHGRRSLAGALHDGGRGTVAGSTRLRLRHAFVGFQIALALMLSIGAGLVLRSAASLGRTDPGFPVEGVLTFRVPFPFGEVQAARAAGTTATPFYEELTRRLRALPGVEGAGWGSCAPLSRFCDTGGFAIRRPAGAAGGEDPATSFVQVSPGFRDALGLELLEGQDLTADDHLQRTNRVLVSRSLARRIWPGESPLERTFTPVAAGRSTDPKPFTVAGVVADVRFDNLRRDAGAMVYAPVLVTDQANDVTMATFVLRASVPSRSLLAPIRQAVAELRPDIPVAFAETMKTALAHETAPLRFSSLLMSVAAAVTLLLAILGVYGVLAYVVGLRRPEFGLRLAMGASGAELRRMVLVEGMTTAVAGAAVGLIGAAAASRLARAMVVGVTPLDPATYVLAVAILLIAAAAAAWLPARRASRVHPAEVLRGT